MQLGSFPVPIHHRHQEPDPYHLQGAATPGWFLVNGRLVQEDQDWVLLPGPRVAQTATPAGAACPSDSPPSGHPPGSVPHSAPVTAAHNTATAPVVGLQQLQHPLTVPLCPDCLHCLLLKTPWTLASLSCPSHHSFSYLTLRSLPLGPPVS